MNRDLPDTRAFAPFEWMLALRYLRARRKEGFISVISLFSFLGILLGVATLIVVMAVLNGFRAELLDKILGFAGHVAIYRQDAGTIMNDGEIRLRMEKIPGVVRVVTLVEGQAMAASLHSATGALVRGISEADIAQLPSINNEKLTTALMVAGVPDAAASFTGFDAAAGVAIGKRMAWRHRLALGSTLTIISPNGPETVVGNTPTIRDFQVVAIFDAGMSDYDENVIYMPLAAAKEYFNTEGGVSMIEATIADPEAVDGMVADFAAAAGRPHQRRRRRSAAGAALPDVRRPAPVVLLRP